MASEDVCGPGRNPAFPLPQFVTRVRGVRTGYSDAGQGPVVLFLHGLAANLTYWGHVAPHFIDNHRVICLDLPGHGASGRPAEGCTIRGYVNHVKALLDGLCLDRVTVIGHSMGGMVAAAMGLHMPERVERLVLVNPAGLHPMPRPIRVLGPMVLRERVLNPLLPRVWRLILRNVFYQDNQYTRDFIRIVEETYPVESVREISYLMQSLCPDLLGRSYGSVLHDLERPVWLIWGQRDRLVPARMIRQAAQRLPHVTAEEVPNCGHMPIIEQPERVTAFLRRALGNPSAAVLGQSA